MDVSYVIYVIYVMGGRNIRDIRNISNINNSAFAEDAALCSCTSNEKPVTLRGTNPLTLKLIKT